jgi:hypothetical protein
MAEGSSLNWEQLAGFVVDESARITTVNAYVVCHEPRNLTLLRQAITDPRLRQVEAQAQQKLTLLLQDNKGIAPLLLRNRESIA